MCMRRLIRLFRPFLIMFVPKNTFWLVWLGSFGFVFNACRNAEMRPPNASETQQIEATQQAAKQAASNLRYDLKQLIIFNHFKKKSLNLEAQTHLLTRLDKGLERLFMSFDSTLECWQHNPKIWTIQQQNKLQMDISTKMDSLTKDLGVDFPFSKNFTDALQKNAVLLTPQTFQHRHPFVALWAYKLGVYQAAQAIISYILTQYAVPDLRYRQFLALTTNNNYQQKDTKLLINILEIDKSPFRLKNFSKSPHLDIYTEYPIYRLVDSSRSALQNLGLIAKNLATGENESTTFVFE
jgi:hypothetical protein